LPLLDAKKKSFFTALYLRGKRISPYLDSSVDELIQIISDAFSVACSAFPDHLPYPSLLLTGPAVPLVQSELARAFPGTVADNMEERGYAVQLLNMALKQDIINLGNLCSGPLYLRKSDAELNG
jgi:tRNA threonylcarbamoyladenosine biosynthesis protein TsaB